MWQPTNSPLGWSTHGLRSIYIIIYTDAPRGRYREKVWRQLLKDATSYIEQIQKLTSHKTPAIRSPSMLGRALLLSLDSSTLSLIRTLYCWVLSKEVSSTIFKSLVWRDLGLNPSLPDHWRTVYPLVECFRYALKWEQTMENKGK